MRFIDRFVRAFSRFGATEKAWNRYQHPGLGIGAGASLSIEGHFRYGARCSVGEGTTIIVRKEAALTLADDCYLGRYMEICPGGAITIGEATSIQDRCIVLGEVTIGCHCLLAPNIMLSSGHHHFDLDPTWLIRDQDRRVTQDARLAADLDRPIVIEDDCWLGINSVVMRGVTVGRGAVVGAGAIVVDNVQPYSVVAGVPAKEIKKRLSFVPPKRISALNSNQWPYFYSGFELSQESISRYSAHGGIAARGRFVLCLDASSGSTVHMVVKCLDAAGCDLSVGHERQHVGADFLEVIFDCGDESGASARVEVQMDPSAATVIVQEAWMT
jgi:acetyltransferase-like isoleucine patch superfamily enzyme